MSEKQSSDHTFTILCTIAFIVVAALKYSSVAPFVAWSWLWVFAILAAPILIGLGFAALALVVAGAFLVFAAILRAIKYFFSV